MKYTQIKEKNLLQLPVSPGRNLKTAMSSKKKKKINQNMHCMFPFIHVHRQVRLNNIFMCAHDKYEGKEGNDSQQVVVSSREGKDVQLKGSVQAPEIVFSSCSYAE